MRFVWAMLTTWTKCPGVSASWAWSHGRELGVHAHWQVAAEWPPMGCLVLRTHSVKDNQEGAGTAGRNVPGRGGWIEETRLVKGCSAVQEIEAGVSGGSDWSLGLGAPHKLQGQVPPSLAYLLEETQYVLCLLRREL